MTEKHDGLYDAFAARDSRFDGVFFMGVTSTGIYCRPVCTAKTPKPANCRFFESAAAAEMASFRPCLRCRPELAPGRAPVDGGERVASRIATRISEGMFDDGAGLDRIADEFHFSSRQIRRIVRAELGVSPIDLVLTRRLLLAKQLLTETRLSVTEIAFASGFSSLRRFNDAFLRRYGMPPTRLRKSAGERGGEGSATTGESFTLKLGYRPPYDWAGILAFLSGRALTGVEHVTEDAYQRTVMIGKHTGWISVTHDPAHNALLADISYSLMPVLPALLSRVRDIFDLRARPDLIAERLGSDPTLRDAVRFNPGLRVPGAFDGFELALRAILGQQITVKAAATLARRFTTAFGKPVKTPHADLTRLAPTPRDIAKLPVEKIAELGIIRSRANSIIALASAVADGSLVLEAGADPHATMEKLVALPGIGPWTANYIAMRALRWPDAFPKEDIALRNRLGGVTAAVAEEMSAKWRPWRSYATLHIWSYLPVCGSS